ncbi:MAG: hypothetical protein IKA31_04660 [Clostridia bacterium]|nr:hypothetical protein [Clostridia bacterium]MBR3889109.1 hypothetical protein [bacterium]
MLCRDTRKTKDGKEILEEIMQDSIYANLCIEDGFIEIETVIESIRKQLALEDTGTATERAIVELQQATINILNQMLEIVRSNI